MIIEIHFTYMIVILHVTKVSLDYRLAFAIGHILYKYKYKIDSNDSLKPTI